jgi:hypothetical protein
MSFIADLLSLLGLCLGLFFTLDRQGFVLALVIGVVLAALLWVACSNFSKLWNFRFRTKPVHHLLCFVAAALTLVSTVLFAALKYTKEAAYASLQAWEVQINLDEPWADLTYAAAFEEVRSLGIEDFSKVPLPGLPGTFVPTTSDQSIFSVASVYANGAASHFKHSRQFLSLLIQGKAEVPGEVLQADVKNYFATVAKIYPRQRAIALAAEEMRRQLDMQVPPVVTYARVALVAVFLLAQALAFGLVAWAAYKDLKIAV